MQSDDWRGHVVSFNPACRWRVDVCCVVYTTTKIFRPKYQSKIVGENTVNKIHHKYWSALISYILRVWLIHGRWNTLKQCIRKFSRLEDWCRMEYDAVSTCKFLFTLRRTEMRLSSGICSPRRDREDEGIVLLQRSTAIYHSTRRIMPEHPNHQHRLCEKLEWCKK